MAIFYPVWGFLQTGLQTPYGNIQLLVYMAAPSAFYTLFPAPVPQLDTTVILSSLLVRWKCFFAYSLGVVSCIYPVQAQRR